MTEYRRADRVAPEVQRELAALLLRDVKDPRVGGALVTGVELTDDLRFARVFYVVHDPKMRSEAQLGLERATAFLRRQLGARLRLRITPELRFIHDESFDRAARIDALLRGEDEP